ncbi:MAG TPA: HypC/HybG/HupF family hydrogenase formation chaperone [Chromatiaceae bacterium]|nr:HypC/HybG/HupF family hydrogenase formation chaperone [Chromatiaceae bacterium]
MCLGIPMRVVSIDGLIARCEAKGVERDANLLMLESEGVGVGDYVVVHLGYAMNRIGLEEAVAAWDIYDQMLAAEDAAGPG